MKRKILALALSALLLTGCTSLLEREYSAAEPHSSKFWESEAAGTLRAENRQDIVNDLLLLIGQHTETATVRLYNVKDSLTAADMLEKATVEIQQQTPMGAYAVEFITTSSQEQRGYYEISVQIGYRRTAEQIQAVVNATSVEAVPRLLEAAWAEGKRELAIRIAYWRQEDHARVEEVMVGLREDLGLTEEDKPWLVSYYPADGAVGLLEFLLDPTEEQIALLVPPEEEAPQENETDPEISAESESGLTQEELAEPMTEKEN